MMFYMLILLVAASRFLPHPPNVACLGALGLFAGCYLRGRRAYLVPLVVLLISDLAGHWLSIPGMGFYAPVSMAAVYLGAAAAVPIGRWMSRTSSFWKYPGGALAASTLFFLISNLGVWAGPWYPTSAGGLISCFTNAIPFFGYTIAGDLVFTGVLFGAWQWSSRAGRVTAIDRGNSALAKLAA
jgi:hypothetical protein